MRRRGREQLGLMPPRDVGPVSFPGETAVRGESSVVGSAPTVSRGESGNGAGLALPARTARQAAGYSMRHVSGKTWEVLAGDTRLMTGTEDAAVKFLAVVRL
jgi:hypothetical protein